MKLLMIFVQMKLDFSSKRQPLFKTTIKISTPFDHFYREFITLMTKLSNVHLCKIGTILPRGNFRSELLNNAQLLRYLDKYVKSSGSTNQMYAFRQNRKCFSEQRI